MKANKKEGIKIGLLLLTVCIAGMAAITGCASGTGNVTESKAGLETGTEIETGTEAAEDTTIMIAAAASLEACLTRQLIPLFEEKNPRIKVIGTYDSSGKLQTQIEEGAEADVFISAALKQMDALKEQGLVEEKEIVNLLVNKIVLIVPAGSEKGYHSFDDIVKAEQIAVGDPESVPAGEYAKEALTALGLWEEVSKKSSFGTNVTEVLNWVAEGSADAGIVYATDAARTDKVKVVSEAPPNSVKNPVYPVGVVKASTHQEAGKRFVDFLQTEEALSIFTENGFAAAQ